MKNPLRKEMRVASLAWAGLLEKEMATHSSILARKIPWTEEPGGLWFMGPQSQTRLSTHAQLLGDDDAAGPPPACVVRLQSTGLQIWVDPIPRDSGPGWVCEHALVKTHMSLVRVKDGT